MVIRAPSRTHALLGANSAHSEAVFHEATSITEAIAWKEESLM
jgi:hypothetical protein